MERHFLKTEFKSDDEPYPGMGWPCPECGKELTTQRGVRQHHTKVHGEPLPNRICKGCGTGFYDSKARRKYCDDCNPNTGEHNGNWKGGKETTSCESCGGEFSFYPSEKRGVYCPTCSERSDEFLGTPSYELADVERVETTCRYCDLVMRVLRSDLDRGQGKFCSRDCLSSWMSEHVVGENHHQWQGGPITYGRRWWTIRRQALERDEHTCQICGTPAVDLGQEPDVHHIEPVRSFEDPQDAHHMENVVCLRRSCHRLVEEGEVQL